MRHVLAGAAVVVGMLSASSAEAGPRKTPRKAAVVKKAAAPTPAAPAPEAPKGPVHIEFGDHNLTGQVARQGGVYIFDRKEPEMKSLMMKRRDFRTEIVGTVQ